MLKIIDDSTSIRLFKKGELSGKSLTWDDTLNESLDSFEKIKFDELLTDDRGRIKGYIVGSEVYTMKGVLGIVGDYLSIEEKTGELNISKED